MYISGASDGMHMCRSTDCEIFRGKAVFCDTCGGVFAREMAPAPKVQAPAIVEIAEIEEGTATPATS